MPRPGGGFHLSVEGRELFPLEPHGGVRLVQVATLRRAEDTSRLAATSLLAAGFVNFQIPPAAQSRDARCFNQHDGTTVAASSKPNPSAPSLP